MCPQTAFTGTFRQYYARYSPPDIVQCDPTELVLKLTAYGVKSVPEFDFIYAPHHMAILRGISTLDLLGAYSPMGSGSANLLSNLGK